MSDTIIDRVCQERDEAHALVLALMAILKKLEEDGLITLDPDQAEKCCGIFRDENGRCSYRPGHPVFVRLPE